MSKERVDFLERDEEYRLAVAYKNGDRRSGERLLAAYRPFAHRLAAESRCPLEIEERQQIAMIAMSKALEKFDPETGNRLSTFARQKIKWALADATNAALCRPFTEGSPHRDDISDHQYIPSMDTPEEMLAIADEWSKRHAILEDAIGDLDALDAELARSVILVDRKSAASPIIRRHGVKISSKEALDGALERLVAAATARAERSGLKRH